MAAAADTHVQEFRQLRDQVAELQRERQSAQTGRPPLHKRYANVKHGLLRFSTSELKDHVKFYLQLEKFEESTQHETENERIELLGIAVSDVTELASAFRECQQRANYEMVRKAVIIQAVGSMAEFEGAARDALRMLKVECHGSIVEAVLQFNRRYLKRRADSNPSVGLRDVLNGSNCHKVVREEYRKCLPPRVGEKVRESFAAEGHRTLGQMIDSAVQCARTCYGDNTFEEEDFGSWVPMSMREREACKKTRGSTSSTGPSTSAQVNMLTMGSDDTIMKRLDDIDKKLTQLTDLVLEMRG